MTLIGALWITRTHMHTRAHTHLSRRQLIHQDVNIVQGHRTAPVGNSAHDCVSSIPGHYVIYRSHLIRSSSFWNNRSHVVEMCESWRCVIKSADDQFEVQLFILNAATDFNPRDVRHVEV